jgi:hypothetical protein
MKKYLGFIAATFLLVEGFSAGAAIAGEWGAVATGANGAYGWAVDYPTEQAAIDAAFSSCNGTCTDGGVSFKNTCAAVATSSGYLGWAAAPTRAAAESAALSQCGDGSCSVQVWGCAGG